MVDKTTLFEQMNRGILRERYSAFKRNLDKNLPLIQRFGGLQEVVPLIAGKHVLIIGAGPSLAKSYSLLKKYQYRAEVAVIAVDMALAPLVRNGITPGFVISCETSPAGFFHGIDTARIRLLAFSCISHYNLMQWEGSVSFYNWMIHDEHYDRLWESAGTGLGYVATGSVVTTQAAALALGCSPLSLVMVGNDLGFHRKFYVPHTIRHRQLAVRTDRMNPLETMEFSGIWRAREYMINREERLYFTNNQFLTAKIWLEELFSKSSVPIYDSSEPGCSEGKVQKTSLKDFFSLIDGRKGRR